MTLHKYIFYTINILGGISVIFSYANFKIVNLLKTLGIIYMKSGFFENKSQN